MGAILVVLMRGPHRFNEILNAVPGISDRRLTERLRGLEAEGMVTRRVLPESPIRVEYELTDSGKDLNEVLKSVMLWSNKWMNSD